MYLLGLWPGIPLSEGCIYLGCGLGFLCLRGVFTWAVAWDSSVWGVFTWAVAWDSSVWGGGYLPGLWPGIPLSEGCIYLGCGLGFLCLRGVFTWAVAWDSSV